MFLKIMKKRIESLLPFHLFPRGEGGKCRWEWKYHADFTYGNVFILKSFKKRVKMLPGFLCYVTKEFFNS